MSKWNRVVVGASMTLCAVPAVFAVEPAFENPTAYGRLNLTIERAVGDGVAADTKFVDNGSRLGVRGGHDFGNDLSADFQFEGRLRNDPDGWIVKGRDTWVGLRDRDMGAIRFGMMEGPLYHATYDEIGMHNHNSGRSEDKLLAENAIGGRMSKSVYFRAPLAGPLKIELLHAFLTKDPGKANDANPGHDEIAITYQAGNSWIAGGYAESRNLKVDKAWTLAASTVVKSIVLAALYESSAAVPVAGAVAYRHYGRVAAKYVVAGHEFHINVGIAGSLSTTPGSGATQTTLGYNYNLTEQSKVYAFATRIDNKRNASYSFLVNSPNGSTNSSIALGIRRNF